MPPIPLPPESRHYRDPVSGVSIRQLTQYLAHSYHLYFTNPGWWGGGRHLLFGSDRGNASNLYSIDLQTDAITRLTDFGTGDAAHDFQGVGVNPVRDEAYWWHAGTLHAIDLRTGATRTIWSAPDGWTAHGANPTADGAFVVASMSEKIDVGPVDLGAGYVGFHEIFEAHPLHRIIRIRTDARGGEPELLHEERNWLGHVNPSPKHANLITYCYEGPWHRVGQRIWGLDLETKKTWKIRPQREGETIGHEYWMEDGDTVGYHGTRDGVGLYGWCRYDNADAVEVPFPLSSNHFHSNRPDLIVLDGPQQGLTPHVLLCRYDGERFHGPRVLCVHRGSRHTQHLHIHPRFTPDGTQVLYTADPRGYGQVFLADVPAFEELPTLESVLERRRKR